MSSANGDKFGDVISKMLLKY